MGHQRGVIEAEVLGRKQKLRLSIGAADKIESRMWEEGHRRLDGGRVGMIGALKAVANQDTIQMGVFRIMLEEMCRDAGAPLGPEDVGGMMFSDLPEIAEAIMEAAEASGVMSRSKAEAGNDDPEKKKGDPSHPPISHGDDGSR